MYIHILTFLPPVHNIFNVIEYEFAWQDVKTDSYQDISIMFVGYAVSNMNHYNVTSSVQLHYIPSQ